MGLRGQTVTNDMETAIKQAQELVETHKLTGTDAQIAKINLKIDALYESTLMLARIIDRLEAQPARLSDHEDPVSEDQSSSA